MPCKFAAFNAADGSRLAVEARRDSNPTVRSFALQGLLLRLSSILDQTAAAQLEAFRCKIAVFDAVAATEENSPSPQTRAKLQLLKTPSLSFFHSYPNNRIAVRSYALQVRLIRCSRRRSTCCRSTARQQPHSSKLCAARAFSPSFFLPPPKQQQRSSKLCAARSPHSMRRPTLLSNQGGAATTFLEVVHCKIDRE